VYVYVDVYVCVCVCMCVPMMKSSRGGGLRSEDLIRCKDSSDR
jgi:hypothetical protein